MSKYIIAGFVVLLLVITSGASYWYLQNQTYYPVVRMALTGGLSITAILPAAKQSKSCTRANERFVAPIAQQCTQCKVLEMRCYTELVDLERAMKQDLPVAYPVVAAADLRIAVMGPPDAARAGCQLLAADIAKRSSTGAKCLLPPADMQKR